MMYCASESSNKAFVRPLYQVLSYKLTEIYQDTQCMYNVTMRRIYVTIFAVEKH